MVIFLQGVTQKQPTKADLKTDPAIATTWKQIKIASALLKVWKITVDIEEKVWPGLGP